LSSFAPKSLPANEIDSSDVVLELTDANAAANVASQPVRRASVRFGSGLSRRFTTLAVGVPSYLHPIGVFTLCQHVSWFLEKQGRSDPVSSPVWCQASPLKHFECPPLMSRLLV
jgi:hypothetical protein